MSYKIASLFCGCGGLDLGFKENNTEFVYSCDNDQASIDTYNYNFEHKATLRDVQDESFKDDLDSLGSVDIVLGGFPCQGFSKSGPKKSDDPRNLLYKSMVDAVKTLQPKVFVAENVDGMAQNYKGQYVSQIKKDFSELGYNVQLRILNAASFGVPQYRRRIIFIGIKKEYSSLEFRWPTPTHYAKSRNGEFKSTLIHDGKPSLFNQSTKSLKSTKSIQEAIGDLLSEDITIPDHTYIEPDSKQKSIIKKISEGQKLCNVRFSDTSVYTWNIPEVFGPVSDREITLLETIGKNRRKKRYGNIPNGNPLSVEDVNQISNLNFKQNEFEKLVEKGYLKIKSNKYDLKGAMFCSGLYKRPKWSKPSPTIITVFHNPRYFVHPLNDRPFSIREVARLQSFPDDFEFLAANISKKDAYRLIGNAVPPKLGKFIASSIFEFLNKIITNETGRSEAEPRRNVQRV